MCRKSVIVCGIILLMTSALMNPVTAESSITVTVDGVALQMDVPPTIIEGRTLVPLRAIFEALGAEIEWNDEAQIVTGRKGDIIVVLPIGNSFPIVNGTAVEIDVPGMLINGRTMVPARFIGESLGASITWDDATRTVVIETPDQHEKTEMEMNHLDMVTTVPEMENNDLDKDHVSDVEVEKLVTTARLGESITVDQVTVTIHKVEFNNDDFRPNDPGSTSIYPKGFGVYYTINNTDNKPYHKPTLVFKAEPTMYEAELNHIGYSHHPVDYGFFIYPGEEHAGFYQYMFDKNVSILEIEVFISPAEGISSQEPHGVWIVK